MAAVRQTVYTAKDAAAVTRVAEVTLKHWASRGIIVPSGEGKGYSFCDLVLARVAHVLRDRSMPEKDILRCVRALATLPHEDFAEAHSFSSQKAGVGLVWALGPEGDSVRIVRTMAEVSAEMERALGVDAGGDALVADAIVVIDVGSHARQMREALRDHQLEPV